MWTAGQQPLLSGNANTASVTVYPSLQKHRATFFQTQFFRTVLPPLCAPHTCYNVSKSLFYQPPCNSSSVPSVGRSSAGYLATRHRAGGRAL